MKKNKFKCTFTHLYRFRIFCVQKFNKKNGEQHPALTKSLMQGNVYILVRKGWGGGGGHNDGPLLVFINFHFVLLKDPRRIGG